MKKVAIINLTHPLSCPVIAEYCGSFFTRLRGYTFRRSIEPDRGILLVQKRDSRIDASIHMLGVFTDLAVVWINQSGEVVDRCLARAWRPAYLPQKPAKFVLEMNPNRLDDFQIGDKVRVEEVWLDR